VKGSQLDICTFVRPTLVSTYPFRTSHLVSSIDTLVLLRLLCRPTSLQIRDRLTFLHLSSYSSSITSEILHLRFPPLYQSYGVSSDPLCLSSPSAFSLPNCIQVNTGCDTSTRPSSCSSYWLFPGAGFRWPKGDLLSLLALIQAAMEGMEVRG